MTTIPKPIVGNLISLAEHNTRLLFSNSISPDYLYHDFTHTERVVEVALLMAKHYQLSEHETELLGVSAWFHDSGYSIGVYHHEVNSAEIALQFALENNISESDGQFISNLILSTKIEAQATTLTQHILRDADLHYLGSQDYFNRANRLRSEWKLTQDIILSDSEWYQMNIDFMTNHKYETDYGRNHFGEHKQLNIGAIIKKKADIQ